MYQQLEHYLTQLLSLLLCCWGLNLKITPVAAQSITPAPDGTGTIINHNGNTYNIDGGTQAGANLFHSFTEFGLNPDEVANFLSNPQIDNILGRVTGGNASVIQGLIQLTGGNSNLYLMNPSGWVFHQGASLDVPGSFGVTTATRMGFGNGYFNADGANVYRNLTGNPTSLIFDQDNPSWIINEADLEVNSGASLWAVGGGIISTGTMAGGEITLAAVPGNNQVRLSHEGMVLNLVLDAAPAGETNNTVTGIQSVDIPRYLTGGSEVGHVNYAIVEADGSVRLVNRDTVVEDGDTVIAGEVTAEDITLMAAGRVKPTDYDLLNNNPVVVLFPEEIGDNLETTFIDEGINDYQGEDAYQAFLYGGKQGTISQVVTHEEGEGIATVTRMLAAIANQGGKVSAIHLLTEGNEGNFWLGRDYVDSENIGEYQQELQQWGAALTAGADILLYSCFTALGITGEQLIIALANYTGADVAASTDLTGSEALGGNWVFEKQTGEIEAGLGFESQVLADFTGKLQVFTAGNAADLIAHITTANGNGEADTINLTGDITLTAVHNTDPDDGANGLPSITDDGGNKLTIDGMGFTIARDAGGMTPNFRLLHILLGAELELNNTTLSNGMANDGGGILNRGTLTLNNSTVSGNTATNRGGGIFNFGYEANAATLTLNNSKVSDNIAGSNGGGIFNYGYDGADAARLTLSNSTVSGNTATNNGGGIYNYGNTPNGATVDLTSSTVSGNKTTNNNGGGIFNYGNDADAATVNLSNSTVSGNTANNKGGGIYNYGNAADGATVTLSNSTVSGNMATNYGGGIYNYGSEAGAATVTVGNSIIADNTAPTDTDVGRSDADNAPITDNGNNLIGIDSITAFNTSTLVGDAMNPRDPKLAPLGDYGGPTQTHALLPDSPALDAGDNAQLMMLANDQRGATRVINTTVDIGAFEAQGFTLSAVAGNGQSSTVNTNFATDLQVQLTEDFDNKPLPGVTITLTPQGTTANANLSDTTLITDANGIVTTTATANTTTGTYQVAATATGVTGVNFNLTNEPGAGILTILAGNNQSTTVNTAFANNLQIQVKDEFGNVLPGLTVTLTSPTTGASSSFGSISLITNDQGIATTTVTANTIAGNYQVEANATGATGNNFNLTNNPGAAAIVNILAGNNQNTTINTAFADNLQVQVTDEFGNGVSGVTVTLSPPGTGASASLGSISLTTDATGLASTTATANSILGDYQVRADIGVSEANFDLSNISAPVVVPGDSTLVIVPGDSTLVVVPGDSTPVVVPANSSPVIVPGNSTPILVTGDSSTNNIPDFTSIWQSVLEELPESGLEESACTTAPAIVINSTQEEEEITLDEEIETAIQRNQDCSPE
ncbi:MAG: DUF4347 domain-containing protein [Symploca sp. SIO1B1]|nr:DUF4347 domain-containing protein [Symploca sp. SIO1B1]